MSQLLTLAEAARRLSVPLITMKRMVASGKVAVHRLGPRTVRISEADLAEFAARCRLESVDVAEVGARATIRSIRPKVDIDELARQLGVR